MNRVAFLIAAWVFFGMELGFKPAMELGASQVSPSFVVVLLVFLAMNASLNSTLGAGLVIGLLLDLTSPRTAPGSAEAVVIVGPYALGGLAAAYAVYTSRTLVVRQNPLTIAFLSFVAAMLMHVAAAALLEIRSAYDPVVSFGAGGELASRFGSSVYTALVALPVGWGLRWFAPIFKFPQAGAMRGRRLSARG